MADTKISALPDAGTLTGAEIVPVVQSGSNAKLALSALYAWILAALAAAARLVPTGGTNGQVVRRVSGVPAWSTVSEVPDTSSATDGEVVRLVGGVPAWSATRELPDPAGATEGDVLTIDGTGTPVYQAPAAGGLTYRQTLSMTRRV